MVLREPWALGLGLGTFTFLGVVVAVGVAEGLRGDFVDLSVGLGAVGVLGVALSIRALGLGRPEPSEESSAGPATWSSAFVCTECSEYSAPPDWQALLRESSDLSADGRSDPTGGRGPLARSWIDPHLHGGLAGADEESITSTVYLPPEPRLSPRLSAVEPEWLLRNGRLVPGQWPSPSPPFLGARRPVGSPVRGGLDALDSLLGPVPASFPEFPATLSVPENAEPSELEGWVGSTAREVLQRSTASAREAGSTPRTACASCRSAVGDESPLPACPDCARPLCEPCRTRAVLHDGDRWCSPCAINRVGWALVEALEEAPEAAPSTVVPGIPGG